MKLNPAALQDLYDMLLSLEWEAYEEADGTTLRICPVCGNYLSEGHKLECKLQIVLRKANSRSFPDR
jgi:hypothetical protein